MLKKDFVPVAIDQWYQRRQKDAEGEFYRKVAAQGPRNNFDSTTQGNYICSPDGKLFAFNNNRGPERIRNLMKEALEKFDSDSISNVEAITAEKLQYDITPPSDGLILRVHAKIMGGYEPAQGFKEIFQTSVGRDNCWLKSDEHLELAKSIEQGGPVPPKIVERIARYHLIDFTRGEPPRWKANEVEQLDLKIEDSVIKGSVRLETADGKRGYVAKLLGKAEAKDGKVVRFDLVAKGEFWGEGQYTKGAPDGKFPLVVALRIGDGSDPSDQVLPHAAKGWIDGYFTNEN